MKLHPQWRRIVKKAWSVRLMLLAGLLSGCEVVLPLYSDAIPRNIFAALSMLAIGGGFTARVIAQKDMGDD